MNFRIGIGYDSHRLAEGRMLVLGGVNIPFEKGLLGHSDGDVLCHAIVDAIIGAMGVGDIGRHFPDTDTKWKDYSSIRLLRHVVELVHSEGLKIVWIDSVIMAERPKLASHISLMKDAISQAGILPATINIKAKTNEGMGFIGCGEGIAAQAVCLLMQA
ncbi:2-C-methyl-D-erythritol 2,4-cyclodiphosphate synthase [Thermodesulfovibrionales bacterium]|nr:2-C-methyl-D-erythritol 2,4-cyclodiphosphate synthase [Thermodesulfovibrionales bacterium]